MPVICNHCWIVRVNQLLFCDEVVYDTADEDRTGRLYPLELLHTGQSVLPVGRVQLFKTGGRKYTCSQVLTHLSLI